MKTFITLDKKATLASNKKQASLKLGVSVGKVHLSGLHIDYLKGYKIY